MSPSLFKMYIGVVVGEPNVRVMERTADKKLNEEDQVWEVNQFLFPDGCLVADSEEKLNSLEE